MGRFTKREFRLGAYYVGKRSGSVSYYRIWVEEGAIKRVTLDTDDFDTACERLREWYILNHAPKHEKLAGVFMSDVLARYSNETKKVRSTGTIRGHIKHWNDYFGADTIEEACTYPKQEAFKGHLQSLGLAPNTINHIISTGRAAVRLAWKRGEITSVPPFSTVPVIDQEPMGRPISVEETKKLLSGLPPHIHTLLVLCMGTAARPGALMELQWPQVDFDAGLITLNPTGRRQNKKFRPVVKMPAALAAYLTPLKLQGGPVVSWNGQAVKSIKTSWRKHRARLGMDEAVNLYSLRHTMGRWMRSKGVPVDQIQAQLGHRRLGVTERYAEYDPSYLSAATAAIEEFMCLVGVLKPEAPPSHPAAPQDTPVQPAAL